jgi:hypothetical protein
MQSIEEYVADRVHFSSRKELLPELGFRGVNEVTALIRSLCLTPSPLQSVLCKAKAGENGIEVTIKSEI